PHGGDEVGAEAAFGADQLHDGGGQVAFVLLVGDGHRREDQTGAETLVGAVLHRAQGGRGLFAHGDGGVGEIEPRHDAEGQGGGLDVAVEAAEGFLRHHGDALLVGRGDVHDGELVEAPAL